VTAMRLRRNSRPSTPPELRGRRWLVKDRFKNATVILVVDHTRPTSWRPRRTPRSLASLALRLAARMVVCEPSEVPEGFATGSRFTVPLIDMPTYLGYLQRRLAPLDEATAVAPVVANSTGMDSTDLVPDPSPYSVRGQRSHRGGQGFKSPQLHPVPRRPAGTLLSARRWSCSPRSACVRTARE
jgi:hypothetical protein